MPRRAGASSRRALGSTFGWVVVTSLCGACQPDLDILKGPDIANGGTGGSTSGSGGSDGCDGGSCAEVGGTGGSASGGSGSGGTSGAGVNGGSGGSSIEPEPTTPQLRYDFEDEDLGLQGWVAVGPQRPVGVQDGVERTSEAAHSGTYSIRMVFDGTYPDAAPPADPFWGIQRSGGPPSDAQVTFWMMTTAEDVSIEVFAQTGPTFTWNILTNTQLAPNTWREFSVFIPASSAGALRNWGMKVYGPLNMSGYIYLDEVSW